MHNKPTIVTVLTVVLSILTMPAIAQEKTPPKPGGYWIAYFGDNKINSKIGIHSEVQFRNYFLTHSVQTLLLRTGLNYYIHPTAMATVGYGYILGEPTGDEVIGSKVSEHRLWQQVLLRQKHRNVFMDHRFRLEQRFLNNLTNKTQQTDHRIRYRFQALVPFYVINPHLRHYFLAVNNEIMINFGKPTAQSFDRNRFFAGLGYQVSPKMNFQLGYMNQFAQFSTKPKGHTDHIAMFAVSYNMDDLMQTFFSSRK